MYILYWYVFAVTLVSVIAELYSVTQTKVAIDTHIKLGAIVGLVFRQTAFIAFLILVYPALEYFK